VSAAHILVVEDSALVRDAMRTLFEATDRRVSLAGSVAECVAACAADRPDILLLDLTLPDGDGLSALPVLRAQGTLPRVVVALTGHDDPATERRCREAGCRTLLLKPVPTRELLRLIGEWEAEASPSLPAPPPAS
jgi:CheY-like chemotaxis protein